MIKQFCKTLLLLLAFCLHSKAKIFVFCLLFTINYLLLTRPAHAANETFILGKDEIIDSDYLKAGDSLIINGTIKGDCFLMGGVIDVNGNIEGDLFVFGGKVNINGKIGQSLRGAGGEVDISGGVGRNVAVIGGNVSVNKSATVAGSLLAASGNLNVNSSKIEKGIRYFGARMFLNSHVPKDVFVVANQELILGSEASIAGNLKYTGNKIAIFEKGATVSGQILYEPESNNDRAPGFFASRRLLGMYDGIRPIINISRLLVSLFIGYFLLNLFPRIFEQTTIAFQKEPFASLGWGILAILFIVVSMILLTVTLVGIPIALLLGFILFLVSFLAQLLAAFALGRKILIRIIGERRGWSLFLGLIVLYILDSLPFVGGLIKGVIEVIFIGALVISYRQPQIFKGTPLWQEIHKEK